MPNVTDYTGWSSTAALNTAVNGFNIAPGSPAADVNNAIQALMAQLAGYRDGAFATYEWRVDGGVLQWRVSGTSDPWNDVIETSSIAKPTWVEADVATTTNGTLASDFENGDTVDGVTLTTGMTILLKSQSDPIERYLGVVQASGAPTLLPAADTGAEMNGLNVYVKSGTANAGTGWQATIDVSGTPGTDATTWQQISGAAGLAALDARVDTVEATLDGVENTYQVIGLDVAPVVTAAPLGAGTWLYGEVAEFDGTISQLDIALAGATTLTIAAFTRSGQTFTATSSATYAHGGGSAVLSLAASDLSGTVTVLKGQYIGVWAGANRLCATSTTGQKSYFGANAAAYSSTVTDASRATNFRFEYSVTLKRSFDVPAKIVEFETNDTAYDDRILALLGYTADVSELGKQDVLPTTGNGGAAAAGIYVLESAYTSEWVVRRVWWWGLTAVDMEIVRAVKQGTSFVVTERKVITQSVGLNTIDDLGWVMASNERIGLACDTASWLAFDNTGGITGTPYYYDTYNNVVAETFTDASTTATVQLQVTFEVFSKKSDSQATLLFESLAVDDTFGASDVIDAGTNNTSAGALQLAKTATEKFLVERVDIWCGTTAASIVIGVGTRSGTTCTRTRTVQTVTVYDGENSIPLDLILEPGETLNFTSATNGWCTYDSPGPHAGYGGFYYAAAWSSETFTDATADTDAEVQIRVYGSKVPAARTASVDGGTTLTLANSDTITMVGQSYWEGFYQPYNEAIPCVVSAHTDYQVLNYSFSGHTYAALLDNLRTNQIVVNNQTGPQQYPTKWFFCSAGYNDSPLNQNTSFTNVVQDMLQIAETMKAMGGNVAFMTEWWEAYDDYFEIAQWNVAKKTGAKFLNLIDTQKTFDYGTDYGPFLQGTARHPGVRTNRVVTEPIIDFIKAELPEPEQSMKIFRLRSGASTTLANMTYRDDYERNVLFTPIHTHHQRLHPTTIAGGATAESVYYYDKLDNAALYDQNYYDVDEILALIEGDTISYTRLLIEGTLKGNPNLMESVTLTVSDTTATVYVLDGFVSSYPADGLSVMQWRALTGVAGVYTLDAEDISGCFRGRKIAFLVVNSGGGTLTMPSISFVGPVGVNLFPACGAVTPTGSTLLGNPTFAVTTGWTSTGSLTTSTDTTYKLPEDITAVWVSEENEEITQAFTYSSADRSQRLVVDVWCRWLPEVRTAPETDPTDPDEDLATDQYKYRAVEVSLYDTVASRAYTQTIWAATWWWPKRLEFILPRGTTGMSLKVKALAANIEFAKIDPRIV